jgi:hypothetical protein
MKRTPLTRRTPLRARTELRKANPKRKRVRFARAYRSEAYLAHIQRMPCAICDALPSEAAHVRSRGAGGTWEDLVPLCRDHHREQHQVGIQTFQRVHGIDLVELADAISDRSPA